MERYELQPVTESLLPQIVELEALCFSRPITESLLRHQLSDPLYTLLAAVDVRGRVLGYAGLMTVMDEGYIENVAVHPVVRRMGIGTALIQALLQNGTERELAFLTLEVRESNTPAQRLYENHGFSVVGIRKNYYDKPAENAILMTRFFRDHADIM